MNNIFFTIVAKNYTGLARVLEKSVIQHNKDVSFYIFVADEPGNEGLNEIPNIIVAKQALGIQESLWYEMAFKYNLVEFCTAIKPSCFTHVFNVLQADKAIYLDPDVFLFGPADMILSRLDTHSIVLTPHITNIQKTFQGDYPDYLFLVNGTFNLGFLALKKDAHTTALLGWWQQRLINECFFDNNKGMATDQKWMNLLPAFFTPDVLYVCRDKGLNMAPWNYFERKVMMKEGIPFVANRENPLKTEDTRLIFVHFSGYDYKNFSTNNIVHKKEDFKDYSDLEPVFEAYAAALRDGGFDKYMQLTYSYNQFNNGKNIMSLHRRIFRRLLEEGRTFPHPFSADAGSYYAALKRKKLVDNAVVSADKVTNKTITAFDTKMKYVNVLFSMAKKIMGIRRYSMLIRFLQRYTREENQVFLLDAKLSKKIQ
jgi:hypothetical protein